ncbi:MAG: YfcE family phosphodiesterase [Miltoncostaeaceae bacterium]
MADTHVGEVLPRLPEGVLDALEGSDLILHAGDLTLPDVLVELRRIAPVVAVQGNHDREGGLGLPGTAVVEVAGVTIGVVHGDRPALVEALGGAVSLATGRGQTLGLVRQLIRRVGPVDVVVFGHLHETFRTRVGGTLVFSPGAVCQPEIDPGFRWSGPIARALAAYRRRLPEERIRPTVGRLDIRDGRVEASWQALPEPLLPSVLVSTRCHHPAE